MNRFDIEVYCISNKGVRPGTFTIGNKYIAQSDDVLQVFIVGDNGIEYEWNLVKDLFTTKEQHRDIQFDKLGI